MSLDNHQYYGIFIFINHVYSTNVYQTSVGARHVVGSGDTAMKERNKNPYFFGANILLGELDK